MTQLRYTLAFCRVTEASFVAIATHSKLVHRCTKLYCFFFFCYEIYAFARINYGCLMLQPLYQLLCAKNLIKPDNKTHPTFYSNLHKGAFNTGMQCNEISLFIKKVINNTQKVLADNNTSNNLRHAITVGM